MTTNIALSAAIAEAHRLAAHNYDCVVIACHARRARRGLFDLPYLVQRRSTQLELNPGAVIAYDPIMVPSPYDAPAPYGL